MITCTNNSITNGTLTIAIDPQQLNHWKHLADENRKNYGDTKMEDENFTGNQFADQIDYLLDKAYKLISNELIPNIFDHLPLSKAGLFNKNRMIPIINSSLSSAQRTTDFFSKQVLELSIATTERWGIHDDSSIQPSNTLAILELQWRHGNVKQTPLMNQDGSINDIKQKVAYLKKENVIGGRTYKDANGSVYLYLGKISIGSRPNGKGLSGNYYIRMTKKLYEMAKTVDSLNAFIETYIKCKMDTHGHYYDKFSIRDIPRKFLTEEETLFTPTTDAYDFDIDYLDFKNQPAIMKVYIS